MEGWIWVNFWVLTTHILPEVVLFGTTLRYIITYYETHLHGKNQHSIIFTSNFIYNWAFSYSQIESKFTHFLPTLSKLGAHLEITPWKKENHSHDPWEILKFSKVWFQLWEVEHENHEKNRMIGLFFSSTLFLW